VSAYDPARWSDFALAQLGASAALLGLVFVGFSINLRDIVTDRQLVNRALEAVVALGTVLFRRVTGFGAMALLALAAVTLLAGAGGGLYWWPAAVVIAYVGALTDAWVLIVEILR
jgi:modulator of FtsH protease